jgi:cytochrome c oxidase subunit II
MKLIVPIIIF